MQEGFIIIHRRIMDNWLWLSEPFAKGQAWLDLLLLANHSGACFFIRGIKVEIKRGQVGRSEESLSQRWKWSRGKVRSFLKLLETEQQIKQHKSPILNIIEIINYNLYQNLNNRSNNKKTTERQQKDTNNKDLMNDDEEIMNEYKLLADGLIFVLENKMNKSFQKSIRSSWSKEIKKLVEIDLKNRTTAVDDIKRAIQAISDNYGKEYFPIIQSGGSLREKFIKIENYLQRESKSGINSTESIFNYVNNGNNY